MTEPEMYSTGAQHISSRMAHLKDTLILPWSHFILVLLVVLFESSIPSGMGVEGINAQWGPWFSSLWHCVGFHYFLNLWICALPIVPNSWSSAKMCLISPSLLCGDVKTLKGLSRRSTKQIGGRKVRMIRRWHYKYRTEKKSLSGSLVVLLKNVQNFSTKDIK